MLWLKNKVHSSSQYFEQNARRVYLVSKGCCSIELESLSSSSYDFERLGFSFVQRPEKASLMIVSGWIDDAFADKIIQDYACLQGDKAVLAVGACAISASPYISNVNIRLADLVPVTLYVPGCPPRPEDLLEALLRVNTLQKALTKEQITYLGGVVKSNG